MVIWSMHLSRRTGGNEGRRSRQEGERNGGGSKEGEERLRREGETREGENEREKEKRKGERSLHQKQAIPQNLPPTRSHLSKFPEPPK